MKSREFLHFPRVFGHIILAYLTDVIGYRDCHQYLLRLTNTPFGATTYIHFKGVLRVYSRIGRGNKHCLEQTAC